MPSASIHPPHLTKYAIQTRQAINRIYQVLRDTVWRGGHEGPLEETRVREPLLKVYYDTQTSVFVSQCRRVSLYAFLMSMTCTVLLPLPHFVTFGLDWPQGGKEQWQQSDFMRLQKQANGVRIRLISNWRKLKVDISHWGDHWRWANGVRNRLQPIWVVISTSLFHLRSCKQEKGLIVAVRPTTLHHFLDTVLLKKRVTRRLSAATAVAQRHDNGRLGTSGIRKPVFTLSLRKVCDQNARISRERRRRANGARGRLSSHEGGWQPMELLPAVIFWLRSWTKVLEARKIPQHMCTRTQCSALWICVYFHFYHDKFIGRAFPVYSVRDGGVYWFCFVCVLICIM